MNKEFLELLIVFAKEHDFMNAPVEQVIKYYDLYLESTIDMYIESYNLVN